jgi:hypothetical protein
MRIIQSYFIKKNQIIQQYIYKFNKINSGINVVENKFDIN